MLIGAQGSGKGTQAKRLAPVFGLRHLSTGDLMRAEMAADTALGREMKAGYDRGELVSDEITVGLVDRALAEIAAERVAGGLVTGALFDGFPRNPVQAAALDDLLTKRGETLDAVVEIAVPIEQLIVRLAGRRICKSCGTVFNVMFKPPRKPGVCDNCGGELYQRTDDQPEPTKQRLALYFEQTEPLLAYYRERGLLDQVNGDRPEAVVTKAITAVFARRGVTGPTATEPVP